MPTALGTMPHADHHEAQTVPIASPTTRRQGDTPPAVPELLWFYLCSFCLPQCAQRGRQPVGIKSPAGSRYKGATVPRASPTHTHIPATSHLPRSPGNSQKGGAWLRNCSRCHDTNPEPRGLLQNSLGVPTPHAAGRGPWPSLLQNQGGRQIAGTPLGPGKATSACDELRVEGAASTREAVLLASPTQRSFPEHPLQARPAPWAEGFTVNLT